MIKGLIVVASVVILSGCLPGLGGSNGAGGFMRSDDGGRSFEEKVAIDEKKTIGRVSTLSMAVNPLDSEHLYIGTAGHGIYVTYDGAETWKQMNFSSTNVTGVSISTANTDILYATGVQNERGKVFRSEDTGETWQDIYSEPSTGTWVSSLWMDPVEATTLYIGTNRGILIKSTDSGNTWRNIRNETSEIISIRGDSGDHNTIYALVAGNRLLRSRDAGNTFVDLGEEYKKDIDPEEETTDVNLYSLTLNSIAVDPSNGGRLFVGTNNGIIRSDNFGESWKALEVIGSTIGLPIYAMAVHPRDHNQLSFGAGQVIYTSIEGQANKWSTVDSAPGQSVSVLQYDHFDPQRIFAGFHTTQ